MYVQLYESNRLVIAEANFSANVCTYIARLSVRTPTAHNLLAHRSDVSNKHLKAASVAFGLRTVIYKAVFVKFLLLKGGGQSFGFRHSDYCE